MNVHLGCLGWLGWLRQRARAALSHLIVGVVLAALLAPGARPVGEPAISAQAGPEAINPLIDPPEID
jgi:hypothetical protein